MEDSDRLNAFRRAFRDLQSRAIVRNWPKQLSLDLFGIESTELKGLDEDHFRSLLRSLRQFVNEHESSNFNAVCNVLYRVIDSDNGRAWLKHARAEWKTTLDSNAGISLSGDAPTLEEILDLILYGGVVHADPDKLAKLDSMAKQDPALLRLMLMHLVPTLIGALNLVDLLIRHVDEGRVNQIPAWVPSEQPA